MSSESVSLPRDANSVAVVGGVSSVDGVTPVAIYANPVTHRLLVSAASSGVTEVDTGTGLTGGPITTTGTISLDTKLAPADVLAGNSLKVLRVNAGETAVEYATPTTGTVTTTGSPASGNLTKFSGATSVTNGDLSGDITTTGTLVTTLATVNANVGSFTNASVTVNGKGLVTAASSGAAPVTAVSVASANGLAGSSSGGATPALTLSTTVTGTLQGNGTIISASKVTLTQPATGSTLTILDGKTLTANNSLTLAGTDSTIMTFPSTTATIARTDAAQTFTGTQTFAQTVQTVQAITVSSNAGTADVTHGNQKFTNSSAATMTITLATASAVDGQLKIIRIYDFSAVAQSISWVNTENSVVTAPATSNGSTTLPLTAGFQFNGATSLWRCIASA